MVTSPYDPPKSTVADTVAAFVPERIHLARKRVRLANFLLDYVFTVICWSAIAILLAVAGLGGWIEQLNPIQEQVFGLVMYVAYYVGFEGTFGWTLAKLITGTRVVNDRGEKPALRRILGRSLARLVPFEPFSFFGSTPTGWHDRWSNTRVVSLRRALGPTLAESFGAEFGAAPGEHRPEGWETMSEAEQAIWQMQQAEKSGKNRSLT
jgi:uncharacterized RDD family membrane protein YckC